MAEQFDIERSERDTRIQAYLRAHLARAADHERIGPFLAGFDGASDNPYRNYAVPDDGAGPTREDIDALIAAFVRRKRKPRLEYIAGTAPAVEPALLAAGFEIEKRYPLLICTPTMLRDAAADEASIELAYSDADIVGAAEAGAEAYGEREAHPDFMRRLVAQGGVLAIARDSVTGLIVGAGMATPAHDGVSEVAGIGVRAAYRRRGIAGALTACLAREAFARGVAIAWLVPEGDRAERIYARASFVRASEQLHISKPG